MVFGGKGAFEDETLSWYAGHLSGMSRIVGANSKMQTMAGTPQYIGKVKVTQLALVLLTILLSVGDRTLSCHVCRPSTGNLDDVWAWLRH